MGRGSTQVNPHAAGPRPAWVCRNGVGMMRGPDGVVEAASEPRVRPSLAFQKIRTRRPRLAPAPAFSIDGRRPHTQVEARGAESGPGPDPSHPLVPHGGQQWLAPEAAGANSNNNTHAPGRPRYLAGLGHPRAGRGVCVDGATCAPAKR